MTSYVSIEKSYYLPFTATALSFCYTLTVYLLVFLPHFSAAMNFLWEFPLMIMMMMMMMIMIMMFMISSGDHLVLYFRKNILLGAL